MSKFLKIGVPILVAVVVLVIGISTGLVLAKGNDVLSSTSPSVAYDTGYDRCPQCLDTQGSQGYNCPGGANCGGRYGGCGGGYCSQGGNCPGWYGGASGVVSQPRCGACLR